MSWIGGAAAAARTARSDALWPPSALAALAYLGWVPLVLTVAPSVRTSQLILFGAGLVGASLFPLNLLAIAAGLAGFVLLVCALAAVGESVVLDSMARSGWAPAAQRSDTASIFAVLVVATLPGAIAAGVLVAGLAAIAPDALTSPDQGVPLLVRLATALGPFAIALAAMTLVGQALGAASLRRVVGPDPGIATALSRGARDLLRRPARRLGIALMATLTDLAALALAFGLLGVTWAPVAALLEAGRLLSPETFVRLAGFVLTWLFTLGLMGVAHAWVSAWWSIELASPSREAVA